MMQLAQKYWRRGALVDTNILLLFFVGLFRRDQITRFKRTDTFTEEDFDTVARLLERFEAIVTTPHILTEVSNLAGQLGEHLKMDYFEKFAQGIQLLSEQFEASASIAGMPEFRRFGITDAAIMQAAKGQYLVITDDFRLSQYLQSAGVDVLNFNHIRTLNWK